MNKSFNQTKLVFLQNKFNYIRVLDIYKAWMNVLQWHEVCKIMCDSTKSMNHQKSIEKNLSKKKMKIKLNAKHIGW